MKKFYFLFLSMAAAASSMAAVPVAETSEAGMTKMSESIEKAEYVAASGMLKATSSFRASTKADATINYDTITWKKLGTGQYKDNVLSQTYTISSLSDVIEVEIEEATYNPGVYRLVNAFGGSYKGYNMIVDASNPKCVYIPRQKSPIDDTVDGVTYYASFSWIALSSGVGADAFISSYSAQNITFDAESKTISMPGKSVLLQWPEAPADSEYKTDPTKWYTGKSLEGYIVLPGGKMVNPWTELGTTTFNDQLIGPMFSNAKTTEVKVFEKTSQPGYYKVENVGFRATTVEIDATNPDLVRVPTQTLNFETTDRGLTQIMGCRENFNSDAAFLASKYKSVNITLDKTTGVISFPAQCVFFYWPDWNAQSLYRASEADATSLKLPSASGVNDVVDSESEVSARYFNLQGMEISSPEKGQLVIVRKGNKASKVIF